MLMSYIIRAAIDMNIKIRAAATFSCREPIPDPERTIIPADEKQSSPPKKFAFYRRLNGDEQSKNKALAK